MNRYEEEKREEKFKEGGTRSLSTWPSKVPNIARHNILLDIRATVTKVGKGNLEQELKAEL